jgi:two-component system, NtrC family, nitrogen regulation sensor histidine kinase NtrY
MHFVDNYRKFTKLPVPKMIPVNLSNLIDNSLMATCTFSKFNTIKLEKSIPENFMVITDEKLLSQVIINLLKNACEAFTSHKAENRR